MPAGIREIIVKEKPAAGLLRQRVWNRFALQLVRRQRLHDRRPATGVVEMPITMMAAISAKHCSGFITKSGTDCQTN
jgi:hypothetical protein